jgi:hypothetical protein
MARRKDKKLFRNPQLVASLDNEELVVYLAATLREERKKAKELTIRIRALERLATRDIRVFCVQRRTTPREPAATAPTESIPKKENEE